MKIRTSLLFPAAPSPALTFEGKSTGTKRLKARAIFATALISAAAMAATALMAPQAEAQNLVKNPGFETGDLTNYTTFGNFTGYNGVTTGNDTGGPYAGSYFLELGNDSNQGSAGISQTISTVAGQDYNVSLYYDESGDNSGGAQSFHVSWDGTTIGSMDSGSPTGGYELLSYNVVGTGSDVLSLSGYSNSGYNNIDNLSVVATGVSAAPEPAAWLLMIVGVGGIGLGLRRAKPFTSLRPLSA